MRAIDESNWVRYVKGNACCCRERHVGFGQRVHVAEVEARSGTKTWLSKLNASHARVAFATSFELRPTSRLTLNAFFT